MLSRILGVALKLIRLQALVIDSLPPETAAPPGIVARASALSDELEGLLVRCGAGAVIVAPE